MQSKNTSLRLIKWLPVIHSISPSTSVSKIQRIWQLDVARGIAVLLMVAFHIAFDLRYFFDITVLSYMTGGWYFVGKLSAILFIALTGVSAAISYHRRGRVSWQRVWHRAGLLTLFGGIITLITFLIAPERVIVFGILQFLAVGSLIVPFFLLLPWWGVAFAGGASLLLGQFVSGLSATWYPLLILGVVPVGFTSLDYYPLFPWLGVALLGVAAGQLTLQLQLRSRLPHPRGSSFRFMNWAGRHSLIIYLLHQPIILSLLWLFFIFL